MGGAIQAEDVNEAGVRRHDVFCILRERVVEHFQAAHHLGAVLEIGFGGGGHQLDRFGLGVGSRDACLGIAFRL